MTQQEWAEWKQHPVTVLLHKYLQKQLKDGMEGWVNGAFTEYSGEATLQANSKAIGAAQCIDQILKLEAHDFEQ